MQPKSCQMFDRVSKQMLKLFISSAQTLRNTTDLLAMCVFFVFGKKIFPESCLEAQVKQILDANQQRTVSERNPGAQTSHIVQHLIQRFKP